MKKLFAIALCSSILMIGFTSASIEDNSVKAKISLKGGDDEGIRFFTGGWDEALAEAKNQDKLIFLDAYASWCGPCKLMEKKTFTDEKVGAFFNKNFINVKMDMEKHPEGARLTKKLQLNAYPSLYFLDKNEELVHKQIGYLKPKQLITVGEIALEQ